MIEFHFNSDYVINNKSDFSDWVTRIVSSEGFVVGQIDYIFCTDDYLLELNEKYLGHDTLTDIITFDYCEGDIVSGDIFISTDRVDENAQKYNVTFNDELLRVMSHGVLHLVGYGDKTVDESRIMRVKENEKVKLFHVEP